MNFLKIKIVRKKIHLSDTPQSPHEDFQLSQDLGAVSGS